MSGTSSVVHWQHQRIVVPEPLGLLNPGAPGLFGPSDLWTLGPLDRLTLGPLGSLDCGTFAPGHLWIFGPWDPWTLGLASAESLVYSIGSRKKMIVAISWPQQKASDNNMMA